MTSALERATLVKVAQPNAPPSPGGIVTATTHPTTEPVRSVQPRPLWRVAGALALAHIALFAAGIIIRGTPTTVPGQEGIEHSWSTGPLERVLAGMWVDLMAFVVLIPVIVFLARAFGRTEAAAWASRTAGAAGMAYVVTVAGAGFAAGAAATWGTAHGLDLDTALAVNNIRNFTYFSGATLLGVHAVGTGIGILADGLMARWLGWAGVLVGVIALLTGPLAAIGVGTIGFPLWMLWFVALAVTMLRGKPAHS
jgi:hypothetical protein